MIKSFLKRGSMTAVSSEPCWVARWQGVTYRRPVDARHRGMMLQDKMGHSTNPGGICKHGVPCDELPSLRCRRGTRNDPHVMARPGPGLPKPLQRGRFGAEAALLQVWEFPPCLGKGSWRQEGAAAGTAETEAGQGPPVPAAPARGQNGLRQRRQGCSGSRIHDSWEDAASPVSPIHWSRASTGMEGPEAVSTDQYGYSVRGWERGGTKWGDL